MNKECFASWDMTKFCNFHCDYCYSNPKLGIEKPLPIKKIIGSLKKTGKAWIISMTGGEPFIYPNFVELCYELTKEHKIAIDTNLSINQKVREFANKINPDKVRYIYISTHIKEREKRNGVEQFIQNLLLLKEKGFNIIVNYVLHPTLIEKFKKDYEYFKSRGIELKPKPFKGESDGKIYPDAYSLEEKELLLKYNPNYLSLVPLDSKGLRCRAGKDFIRILSDGTVTRCVFDKSVLGNIFEGIKLNATAKPCKIKKCNCFGRDLTEK